MERHFVGLLPHFELCSAGQWELAVAASWALVVGTYEEQAIVTLASIQVAY